MCLIISIPDLCSLSYLSVNKCEVISEKCCYTSKLCMRIIKRRYVFCHEYDIFSPLKQIIVFCPFVASLIMKLVCGWGL